MTQAHTQAPARKLIVLMGMTIDGRSADGWIPAIDDQDLSAELHRDVWKQLEDVDTFVFGRVSYEIWERAWPPLATDPSVSPFVREFSVFVQQIRKVVVSRTLKSVSWKNSMLLTGKIPDYVEKMKNEPGRNIAIVGGHGIAQHFTKLGLVDEHILWIHPVIKGSGAPQFPDINNEQPLRLLDLTVFKSGIHKVRYQTVQSTR